MAFFEADIDDSDRLVKLLNTLDNRATVKQLRNDFRRYLELLGQYHEAQTPEITRLCRQILRQA